ncbi:His Kinase A (phospho-acceptor) domain-containing protein [Methanolobus vulcani]|uniref:histidine kinase n=1 Tax=Methanolobus vulcani TaxID=38026 RepID=A0A7Z7AXU2_9EURY|nr:sensor histidine kinase [Methanolobus vulcani]SDF36591.1 His Kinase A (phospho-acceptor) domain-containing protein [Methanolobus vulcani]
MGVSKKEKLHLYTRLTLILFIFSILFIPFASCESNESHTYRIGVLSIYGDKGDLKGTWSPMVDYLEDTIPNSSFEIVPLEYDVFSQKIKAKRIDFFYCNPLLYVEMSRLHGAGRIATVQPFWNNSSYAGMGGVIFTKAGRDDINSLKDLKGDSFVAASDKSLGGYLASSGEFHLVDINDADFSKITFVNSQKDVVLSVIEGEIDAGTVRTGVLESLIRDGVVHKGDVKILNTKEYDDYPFISSTKLYPDWVFAKTASTSDEISKLMTIALLTMPADSKAAISIGASGWTVPADYSSVDSLMRDLRYGMYVDYGKISLKDVFIQYWYILVFIILIFVLFAVHSRWMLDKKEKSQLESSNRLKDLFMDIMRHDLLNPVNVIRGFSDMLYVEETDLGKKESLKMICSQTDHLTAMISSAAKLARLESHEDMEFKVQDIGLILHMVVDSFSTEFSKKGINLVYENGTEYFSRVNDVIEDVFSNIISNSLKYSPDGSTITISVQDKDKFWKIMVADEGDGIPDDIKPLVFDRFRRADKKGIKGSGLGLAIVKRIIDIHKGSVGIDDNPGGKGSVFWVMLDKA